MKDYSKKGGEITNSRYNRLLSSGLFGLVLLAGGYAA